jgi:hypothetical protein
MCRIWARSDARVARNLQINYGTWSSRDSDALCVSASRQVELGDGRVDWLPGSASATGAPACAFTEVSASIRRRANGSKGLRQTVVCGAGTRLHQRNLSVTNAIATDVVLGGLERILIEPYGQAMRARAFDGSHCHAGRTRSASSCESGCPVSTSSCRRSRSMRLNGFGCIGFGQINNVEQGGSR